MKSEALTEENDMSDCCDDKSCEVAVLKKNHVGVLVTVLCINGTLFLIEAIAGIKAHSTGLLGDSLDMLGDAMAYGISLYVIGRSQRWNAGAAAFKAFLMAILGATVLGEAAWKLLHPVQPTVATMGLIGAVALLANLICLGLLWKSRADDMNMRSVWLCSRNDIVANLGVLGAAVLVNWTGRPWPDIAVGACIAVLFLRSSLDVFRTSLPVLRKS
jgi:cation diffusion facilitator family transporter